ncbi:hypothetical protein [Endozoicomonas arenosclerae]|uniref:hypothetical protein n=1 Tax=Endozoicomonas arenosclerae TaxID=1633495 RepID=UPI000784DCC6|nr:hypothetical protein [Endozoicomonas arenosclerae]
MRPVYSKWLFLAVVLSSLLPVGIQGTAKASGHSSVIEEKVFDDPHPRIILSQEDSGAVHFFNGKNWQQLGAFGNSVVLSSKVVGITPFVVVGQENGSVSYYNGQRWELLHGSGWGNSVWVMDVDWSGERPRIMVGLVSAAIEYYDGQKWTEITNGKQWIETNDQGWRINSVPKQISVNWKGNREIVYVLDMVHGFGVVQFYKDSEWKELADAGHNSQCTSLSVDWSMAGPIPRILKGLGNGAVELYSDKSWRELHDSGWTADVRQMSVQWQGSNDPRIVAGLGNYDIGTAGGAIEFYDGSHWHELHGTGYLAPANQVSVLWQDYPQVVVGYGQYLGDRSPYKGGAVEYFNGEKNWVELHDTGYAAPVNQMSANWPSQSNPRVVIGLGRYHGDNNSEPGGAVEYYDGHQWHELHDTSWTDGISQMNVYW